VAGTRHFGYVWCFGFMSSEHLESVSQSSPCSELQNTIAERWLVSDYDFGKLQNIHRQTTTELCVFPPSTHYHVGLSYDLLLGHLAAFLLGESSRALRCGIAVLVHLLLVGFLLWYAPAIALFAVIIPLVIACGTGSYLFYAQHNFPGVRLFDKEHWNYVAAAIESSSYMKMGPIMHWFTGNIGYHHVHHLNAKIPFYRLPEAMAAIPEMQAPKCTSLSILDIYKCFQLKVWDAQRQMYLTFAEAAEEIARNPQPAVE
jgi:fatty acid desaturase